MRKPITEFAFESHMALIRFNARPCPDNVDFGDLFFFDKPYHFSYTVGDETKNFVIPPYQWILESKLNPVLGEECKRDCKSRNCPITCCQAHKIVHTDFSSIPWVFRWLISRTGGHTEASVVHDYLFMLRYEFVQEISEDYIRNSGEIDDPEDYVYKPVGRPEADDVLSFALRISDVDVVRRTLIMVAIRLMSWWVYELQDQPSDMKITWWTKLLRDGGRAAFAAVMALGLWQLWTLVSA